MTSRMSSGSSRADSAVEPTRSREHHGDLAALGGILRLRGSAPRRWRQAERALPTVLLELGDRRAASSADVRARTPSSFRSWHRSDPQDGKSRYRSRKARAYWPRPSFPAIPQSAASPPLGDLSWPNRATGPVRQRVYSTFGAQHRGREIGFEHVVPILQRHGLRRTPGPIPTLLCEDIETTICLDREGSHFLGDVRLGDVSREHCGFAAFVLICLTSFSARSALRFTSTTLAPSRANRIAVAMPLPTPSPRGAAPVTTATLPLSRPAMFVPLMRCVWASTTASILLSQPCKPGFPKWLPSSISTRVARMFVLPSRADIVRSLRRVRLVARSGYRGVTAALLSLAKHVVLATSKGSIVQDRLSTSLKAVWIGFVALATNPAIAADMSTDELRQFLEGRTYYLETTAGGTLGAKRPSHIVLRARRRRYQSHSERQDLAGRVDDQGQHGVRRVEGSSEVAQSLTRPVSIACRRRHE